MRKTRSPFPCTGNSARSQMAEAFLRRQAGDRLEVHSAGLEPRGMNPYTVRGYGGTRLRPERSAAKDVTEYLGRHHFGYLITVCGHAEAHCPRTFLGVGQANYWPIDDPAAFKGPEEETLAEVPPGARRGRAHIDAWLAGLGTATGRVVRSFLDRGVPDASFLAAGLAARSGRELARRRQDADTHNPVGDKHDTSNL